MSKAIKKNKQSEIEINGQKYTYRETMGAALAFKQETGLDEPADEEDLLKYMYHVVKSNCRREGREFSLSFQDFIDCLDSEEFLRFVRERSSEQAEVTEKNV